MKREALGVGGVVGPLLEKREKWGTPRLYYSAVKNERRYYRDAGEGGHPPKLDGATTPMGEKRTDTFPSIPPK
jgi:hypothetical protein